MKKRVSQFKNLGPRSKQWLGEVGITWAAELSRVGAVIANQAVREPIGSAATLNLLYSLHGAIQDVDWRDLSDAEKRYLRAALEERGL